MYLNIEILYFLFLFEGEAKKGRGKDKLVVKTMFNPCCNHLPLLPCCKNAMVVDSHIKSPKQSRGGACTPQGEKCEDDNECCAGMCAFWLGQRKCMIF